METLKKIGIALLIIFFPIGIMYCVMHTLGKSFVTFLGGVFLVSIGIVLGMYIVEPQLITGFFQNVVSWLPFNKT